MLKKVRNYFARVRMLLTETEEEKDKRFRREYGKSGDNYEESRKNRYEQLIEETGGMMMTIRIRPGDFGYRMWLAHNLEHRAGVHIDDISFN